jgi:spermidine synthase
MMAQCLSIILGNTVLRYSLTIGLYLFSLGMGALAFAFSNQKKTPQVLLAIEAVLALIGMILPFLILGGDQLLRLNLVAMNVPPNSALFWLPSWIFMHALIVLIGLLSGAELPILMDLARRIGGETGAQKVLAIDYIGTFLGALAFPLIIYERLGLVAGAALVGGLNAFAALLVLSLYVEKRKPVGVLICTGALTITGLLMFHEATLRSLLVEYVFG